MTEKMMPKYPIYVPTKGRADKLLTARFLTEDEVPFYLVVEPQEREVYERHWPRASILTLPFSNAGSVIPARNWIKDHATQSGYERHWQLDDNIRYVERRYYGKRFRCDAGVAFRACEDFVDRYENIAIAGLNYEMFVINGQKMPPFYLNVHVYSCCLILNSLPHQWRGRYNEDTDICLQVLADGWCTVLFNIFFVFKTRTMKIKGGNTADLYQGDGRLKMARSLERQWPGVVETKRRFERPQHVIKDSWRRFDTPLKLKEGLTLEALDKPNEYGMRLQQVKEEIKSETVKGLLQKFEDEHPIGESSPHDNEP